MSRELSTEEYLRRMFEVIIAEADQSARFRNQLLAALDATVVTTGVGGAGLFDPRVQIQNKGPEATRTALERMKISDLREICDRFGYDADDLPGNRKQPFVNLILAEAQQELDDR